MSSLDMLFSRLTWPSVMVRERAAVAISRLLLSPPTRAEVHAYLLRWMKQQTLESVQIIGLLIIIYAKDIDPTYRSPIPDELDAAITAPSLLSLYLRKELDSAYDVNSIGKVMSLEYAPYDFEPSEFFRKYITSYLPPIYKMRAEGIERDFSVPFIRQWAYEWQFHVQQSGVQPSGKPLDYWLNHIADRRVTIDANMSDIYRSSYLRVLALLFSERRIPKGIITLLVTATCPIDLALWHVNPSSRPTWWPSVQKPDGNIDARAAEIWKQVDLLWSNQRQLFDGECLVRAFGLVEDGLTSYVLEIGATAQQCLGPSKPDASDVCEWLFGQETKGPEQSSLLRYAGRTPNDYLHEATHDFGDWTFAPLSRPVPLRSVCRWTAWRFYDNGPWLPPSFLFDNRPTIVCTSDSIQLAIDGAAVANWYDWTHAVRERGAFPPPKNAGNVLSVKQSILDQFLQKNDAVLCWACRITVYSRRASYSKEFDEVKLCRLMGGTYLARA